MELTPVTPRVLTLTPSQEPAEGAFARVKQDYPDFKNLRNAFASFTLLKAGYP